jgi:hypothetical protein
MIPLKSGLISASPFEKSLFHREVFGDARTVFPRKRFFFRKPHEPAG